MSTKIISMLSGVAKLITCCILSLTLFINCRDKENAPTEPNDVPATTQQKNGHGYEYYREKRNPYNIKVAKAAQELYFQNGFGSAQKTEAITESSYTHFYVQLKPTEEEIPALLKDTTLNILSEPLEGLKVEEPANGKKPYYLVMKRGTKLNCAEVKYIDSLYLPKTQDPVQDFIAHYITGHLDEVPKEVPDNENKAGVTYVKLPEYDPKGLSLEQVNAGGRTSSWGWFRRIIRVFVPPAYTPSGRITFDDDQVGALGVPGVEVRVIHWGFIRSGTTNLNGDYNIGYGFYAGTYAYIVFNDYRSVIKPFDSKNFGYSVWSIISNLVSDATHHLGWKSARDLEGMNMHFSDRGQAHFWAIIKRSVAKYYDYCIQKGIYLPPGKLSIYAHWAKDNGTSFAPLFRYRWGIDFLDEIPKILSDVGLTFASSSVNSIVSIPPDIVIRKVANAVLNPQEIAYQTMKQLALSSMYRVVGNTYWRDYQSFLQKNNLGNEDTPDNGEMKVCEMWSQYVGFNSVNFYYGREMFGEEDPFTGTGGRFKEWIPYGLMYDLTDYGSWPESRITVKNRRRSVIDHVGGYTTAQIFNSISANITTPRKFITAFNSRYGGSNRAAIENLINSYE